MDIKKQLIKDLNTHVKHVGEYWKKLLKKAEREGGTSLGFSFFTEEYEYFTAITNSMHQSYLTIFVTPKGTKKQLLFSSSGSELREQENKENFYELLETVERNNILDPKKLEREDKYR